MELRKDYILDRWAIIAENRAERPNQFKKDIKKNQSICPFCPGNEAQTPPEIYKVEKKGKWVIRVIPNKFPAVNFNFNEPIIQTHNKFYTFSEAYGHHEVIIETRKHGKKFGELDIEELIEIIKTYALRIKFLHEDGNTKYVCLFKNQGPTAGASIDHAHSQIISVPIIPPEVVRKIEAIKKLGGCPYCEIIEKEKNSYRRVLENRSFISFTPYAPRFKYEVLIFPKRHILTFDDFNEETFYDSAEILKKVVQKIEEEKMDYIIAWHYSPPEENLHFHIEIIPRVNVLAGFEYGFGITINSLSPENAAKFYRGEQ